MKSYQLDACDPNAEEDEENLEKRRQRTFFIIAKAWLLGSSHISALWVNRQ